MPSTSKKQHNFMEAVAHNPSFAKKAGVPQSVGKDFSNADKGKTFKRGGDMATKKANPFMEMIAKKKDMAKGKKAEMPSKMGKPVMKKGMDTAKDGMKMASGGMPMPKQSKVNVGMGNKYSPKPEQATVAMKKGGMASTATVNAGKKQSMNYDTKKGKSVSASAAMPSKMSKVNTNPRNIDGVAKYGKTQGKTVKMNMGGKAC